MERVALNLSPEEQKLYKASFVEADKEELGVLTGDKAVDFFAKSNLPTDVLGLIWQQADNENNGFLTQDGFNIALRLIGHAQAGTTVSPGLEKKPGPLPKFGAPQSRSSASAIPKVAIEDKTKFMRIFMNSGPSAGLLDGDKARDIFVKSSLPFEQLSAIWNLADTKTRGSLDATDFILGMHLIQLAMSKSLPPSGLPTSLPPYLYESALVPVGNVSGGPPSSPIARQTTGILKPQSTGEKPIVRQNTGQKVQFSPGINASSAQSPGARAFGRAPPQQPWDISPADKARSDGFFDTLDTKRQGYVEGDQAVPFFLESQLPESALAQIWDLSDIRKEGNLNKDEFAVAMRLINDQLDGKPLPSALPNSLIPPSLRDQVASQTPQGFSQQQQYQQQSQPQQAPPASAAEQDLFSLMDEPDETPAPVQPQTSRTFSPQPTALSPQATGSSFTAPNRDLFPPTAVFNTAVNQPLPPSGAATPRPPSAQATPSFAESGSDDFFGEDNSKQISDHSIQIGQTQNALNASSKGLSTLSNQRAEMEKNAASVEAELNELKEKLEISRKAYEAEQKVVNDLTIKAGEHKKDLANVRKEVVTAESDLSALRDEKREWQGVTMRDKEEIRGLKSKLGEVTKEVSQLKLDIEKLKKEGRQQKGLLAISKKQLTTAEAEKQKVATEIADLQREEVHLPFEGGQQTSTPASVSNAAVVPLPSGGTPNVQSPATSVKSTNPFDRFMSPQTTGNAPLPSARSVSPAVSEPFGQPSVSQGPPDGFADPDPFGSSEPAVPTTSSADFDTAFQSTAFDADFNSAFVPDNSSAPSAHQTDPSFDSAFDDFNPSSASASEPLAAPTEKVASVTVVSAQQAAPELYIPAPAAADQFPPVETFDESEPTPISAQQSYVTPRTDGEAAPIPLPTQFTGSQPPALPPRQQEQDLDSSDGEDDSGPEDLDTQRRGNNQTPPQYASQGTAQASSIPAHVATESPFGEQAGHSQRSSVGSSLDDFEDARERTADLGSPTGQAAIAEAKSVPITTTPAAPVDDFDQFDQDFVNLGPSAPNAKPEGLDAFEDDDFSMDFNDNINKPFEVKSFDQPTSPQNVPSTSNANLHPSSGMFDDSFGSGFGSQPTSAAMSAPAANSAPIPSPAAADDLPAVGRLCSMGFSRTQAIDALEKYNYSVEKAANYLVTQV